MGCYSDGVFAINYNKLKEIRLLSAVDTTIPFPVEFLDNYTTQKIIKNAVYCEYETVKMYSYADVKRAAILIDFLDYLERENVTFAFVRIGDDIDDIELRGDFNDFGIYVNRSIEYN